MRFPQWAAQTICTAFPLFDQSERSHGRTKRGTMGEILPGLLRGRG